MPDTLQYDAPASSIFDEVQQSYEHTPAGKRIIHYFVDMLIAYGFVVLVFGAIMVVAPAFIARFGEGASIGDKLLDRLLTALFIVLAFTLIEGGTKGRTLGKLLTGSVAVREDGSPITWRDAFLRSLSRIVPFEPLSGFSNLPWHDKWTKTTVVYKRSLRRYV